MRIEKHADSTEELFGYRAVDIHEWIDQYFDQRLFKKYMENRRLKGWTPYSHRQYLHNIETLPKVIEAFRDKYPPDIIEKVFIQHLKDDYDGYVPSKSDFNDPEFLKKYHRRSH